MMGISIWQLLIIFAIIVLLFGTKKLRNIGSDLGNAVKGFKNAVTDEPKKEEDAKQISEKAKSDESETISKKEKDQA